MGLRLAWELLLLPYCLLSSLGSLLLSGDLLLLLDSLLGGGCGSLSRSLLGLSSHLRLVLAEGVIGLTCCLVSILLLGSNSSKLLLEVGLAGGRVSPGEGKLLQHLVLLLLGSVLGQERLSSQLLLVVLL